MAGQTLQTTIAINARVGNGFSQVGATLTELGSMVDGISRQLIEFGTDSVRIYRDYEKSMADAEVALSTTYGRGTTQLNTVMAQLDTAATEWAATTIFHTNDVGNAIAEAAHAGWDLDQIMSGIPAAMQLAQAGGIDLSEAVNYIVKATSAAGIGFEDMGSFIDLWAFAANSSATNIDEMGEAMLKMGSTMRFVGNPEELMTLIAVTANAGTVGSAAGTLIRNSMLRLIAPTDKAKEAMGELGATSEETAEIMGDEELAAANARLAAQGFSAYDENGQLKSTLDTYRELYVSLGEIAGGYENIEKNEDALAILGAIFPTRTITEALTLLRGAAEGYDGLYDSMMGGDAEGYGAYAAETMMDTLDGKIETFGSKVERLKQLVGEELAQPVEYVIGLLGNVADYFSGLDDGAFSVLVAGAEGLAAAGPGLLLAGGAFRLIGMLATPVGATAAAIAGLVTGVMMLKQYNDVTFEENFGEMALDMSTLKASIEGITTSADEELAPIRELTSQLEGLETQYSKTTTALSTSITTSLLSGTKLDEAQIQEWQGLGEEIQGYVMTGIQTARVKSLETLNTITPDAEEMTPEQAEAYGNMYGWLESYYGGMESEATAIGERINQALEDALNGDISTEELREQLQSALRDYDEIVSEWQDTKDRQSRLQQMEKAHSVSFDSIEEFMGDLGTAYQEESQQLQEDLEAESAKQWDAANQARIEAGQEPLTQEEWHASDEYQQLLGKYGTEKQNEIDETYGQIARTALDTLMRDSDLSGSWEILKAIADDMSSRDLAPGEDPYDIDLRKYVGSEGEAMQLQHDLKEMEHKGGLLGYFGLGDTEIESLLKPWEGTETGEWADNLINNVGGWAMGALSDAISRYGSWTEESEGYWSGWSQYNPPEPPQVEEPAETTAAPTEHTLTLKPKIWGPPPEEEIEALGQQHTLTLEPHVSETLPEEEVTQLGEQHTLTLKPRVQTGGLEAALQESGNMPIDAPVNPVVDATSVNSQLPELPVLLRPHVEGADPASELQGQGVQVQVDGDTQSLQAQIDGFDGQTLMEFVSGDASNLSMTITSQDGKVLHEHVTGDASSLASIIEQYNGKTITVNIRGNNMFSGSIPGGGFAEGGRADVASIFGEAGPEWAIPEEHSERTAELLNAARAASGFTWPELLARNGGLNASSTNVSRTLVYAPTVYADNADGVDRVLQEDKERMDKWYREKEMRDDMEVYA